jgi:hypothetical protein
LMRSTGAVAILSLSCVAASGGWGAERSNGCVAGNMKMREH